MSELIPIHNQGDSRVVSARDLYDYLGPKERFANWMGRCFQYGFTQGVDYTPLTILHPQNKQEISDFSLTLDCAKEISMLQKSEKGKQARLYFINIEKQAKKPAKILSSLEMLELSIQAIKEQGQEIKDIKNDLAEVKAKLITSPVEYFAVAGYWSLKGLKIDRLGAANFGRKATKICKELGYAIGKVSDPRFGMVNTYPSEVLDIILTEEKILPSV